MTTVNPAASRGVDRALRELATDAAAVTSSLRGLYPRGKRDRMPTHDVLAALAELQVEADSLHAGLVETSRRIGILQDADADARRFGNSAWSERRRALREAFAADPVRGAGRWLTAWVDAVLAGRGDEANRLMAIPFPFPEHLTWLRDRCAAAISALGDASPERWYALGRFLTEDLRLDGEPTLGSAQRAGLLIVEARLRALGGAAGATALLDRAQVIDPQLAPKIALARTMAERLASPTGEPSVRLDRGVVVSNSVRAATASRPAPGTAKDPPTGSDLASVVEWLQRLHAEEPERDLLPEATRLVATLPSAIGMAGEIVALLEIPPAELSVSLAERLRQDGLVDDAVAQLNNTPAVGPVVQAAKARVWASVSSDIGESSEVQSEALYEVGRTALQIGRLDESIAAYEAALVLTPDSLPVIYGLAEGLRISVESAGLNQARPELERALELCNRANDLRKDSDNATWGLLVDSDIAMKLGEAATESRAATLWRSVVSAGRAVAIDPSAQSWLALSNILSLLSYSRAAGLACRFAEAIAPDSEEVLSRKIDALTWLGRFSDARKLLKDPRVKELFGTSWVASMNARNELFAGNNGRALTWVEQAIAERPEDRWTREVAAQVMTLRGNRQEATEAWEVVWRNAPLDEFYGLVSAAWAALGQDMFQTATEMASELIALERASVDDGDGHAILGIASLILHDRRGWKYLEAAAQTSDRSNVRYMHARFRAILKGHIDSDQPLDAMFERRRTILDRIESFEDSEQVAFEMGAVLKRFVGGSPTEVLAQRGARLTRALCRYELDDMRGLRELRGLARETGWPELASLLSRHNDGQTRTARGGVPRAEDVWPPAEPDLTIEIPSTWLDTELLPPIATVRDVIAVCEIRGRQTPNSVVADAAQDLEADRYRIHDAAGNRMSGRLHSGVWYCRRQWLPALSDHMRNQALPSAISSSLVSVPAPAADDTMTRLVAWSPVEVITRSILGLLTIRKSSFQVQLIGEQGGAVVVDLRRGPEPASQTLGVEHPASGEPGSEGRSVNTT